MNGNHNHDRNDGNHIWPESPYFIVIVYSTSYFLFVSGDNIPEAEKSKQLPAHLQKHLRDRLLIDPEVCHSMHVEMAQ